MSILFVDPEISFYWFDVLLSFSLLVLSVASGINLLGIFYLLFLKLCFLISLLLSRR